MSKEWEYYNHALVPATAPHVEPDTSWMKDGKKWRERSDGKYPLFARWTTDFDCGEETRWWFVIKDAPFVLEELPSKERYHIRQALRKCEVREICAKDCIEDLFRVYTEAYVRYKNVDNRVTHAQFREGCLSDESDTKYWGGYDLSGRMIGYMTVIEHEDYAQISTAKFSSDYMNLRVSNALYYTVLNYYLNERKLRYISSGERSIHHATNTQEYKIKTFGFRKAYCRLHIKYRRGIGWLVRILYPARRMIEKLKKPALAHQVAAVLRMEEIHRTF